MTVFDRGSDEVKKQLGFSLIEMVAVLVVIVGVILAANYYRGRPASDPTSIDRSLPNFESATRTANTSYFLEGTVHKVRRSDRGIYFMVRTPGGKTVMVVGTPALTGGMAKIQAGQAGAMQVQMNMGASLTASVQVVSPAEHVDVFVYRYMVTTPAPANYVDPEAEEAEAPADPTAPGIKAEKDDD
jgi:prepilin-type N-terminal cleavage/methylation domain-containing protein